MTPLELAEHDLAEKNRLHRAAIAEVRREISINRDRKARTDLLERHLLALRKRRPCPVAGCASSFRAKPRHRSERAVAGHIRTEHPEVAR